MNSEILQINFVARKAPSAPPVIAPGKRRGYTHLGGGDYVDRRNGHHYENVKINGRYTWRKLAAITHPAALKEIRKKRSDQQLAKLGLAKDPYIKANLETVADLCQFYLKQNCPRKNVSAIREGNNLVEEQRRVATLIKWPGLRQPASEFKLEHCRQYHAWRIAQIAAAKLARAGGDPAKISDQRTGDRQVDKELVTLSNVFRCAMRHSSDTGVSQNPIGQERERFRNQKQIQHCRSFQPADGDELHLIARTLFESDRSAVLGWQTLLQAMIGPRANEILCLRIDAQTKGQPGYIHWNEKKDGGTLYLLAKDSHKGTYGHIRIHPPLAACLQAHAAWHTANWPRSPWYFPSPDKPGQPVGPASLTHALERVTAELGLPKRTSHGLRSYYVNVLRSDRRADGTHKYSDAEIALRIGQKTGGKLIIDVYGDIPDLPLSWMPSDEKPPAWQPFTAPAAEQLTLSL